METINWWPTHTRTKFGILAWFGYYGACKCANACIIYYGKDSQKKKKKIMENLANKWW